MGSYILQQIYINTSTLKMHQNFKPLFNIPTTLKLQVAVRGVGVAPSVAVHVTGLVPTGKEP